MTVVLWLLVLAGLTAVGYMVPRHLQRRRIREATPDLVGQGFIVDDKPNSAPSLPFPEFRHARASIEFAITRRGLPDTAFQLRSPTAAAGQPGTDTMASCAIVPVPFSIPLMSIKRGRTSVSFPASGTRVKTDLERFDQMFEVTSTDERSAFTLLSYEVMEWFLQAPWLAHETTFRISGTHLLAVRPRIQEPLLPNLLRMTVALRETFPPVLSEFYPTSAPSR